MDFIKKAAGGGSTQNQGVQGTQAQNTTTGTGQNQDDYVDKAFGMAAKKSGHNVDRNTQEKITDAGRAAYEKATGKNVPDKVSN
ncbi:hypothetical protein PT974_10970 [Cladobotryum mycophilum]|uniref:Uncharacterized protein n=1 Tax=Cladobotryum mycophilum TaxID=491253 RepID=A0ABR0SCU2_9HYPO